MWAMLRKKDDSDSNNESGDSEFDGCCPETPHYSLPFFSGEELNKKTKLGHCTAETVVEITDKNGKLVPV